MNFIKKTMTFIWTYINSLSIKTMDKIDSLSKKNIRIITLLTAFFISTCKFFQIDTYLNGQELIISFFAMTLSIYLILRPFFYYFRPKFIVFFENHIVYSVYLLIYFFMLVPFLSFIDDIFLSNRIDSFIINLIYTIIIVMSILFILIIIVNQFLTTIFHRRKINELDIVVIFITYFATGFTYGSLFYISDKMSKTHLFEGIIATPNFQLENYLNYLYISLGALTSVGSGNIVPINVWIRLLYVQETILGFFLINFTLGYIFLIVGSKIASQNSSDPSNISPTFYLKTYLKQLRSDLQSVEKNENKNKGNSENNT